MTDRPHTSPRGESTRDALIEAATLVFARERFGSANLREIAQAARVNPALIGYHFQNKEGLYLAVFERMLGRIRSAMDPALADLEASLAAPADAPRERLLEPLLRFVETLLGHMVHEHPAWGELIVQELQAPTAAFDLLFRGMMQRAHGLLARVLVRLRPNDEPAQVRLLAASIICQAAVVRISRAPLQRLMGWDTLGDRELAAMQAQIRRNTALIVLGD